MTLQSAVIGREVAVAVRQERHNVLRLAIAQALAGANSIVVYATGAVVGDMLAPTKSLATLPVSVFVVGMALSTLPAGAIAQRHGRRAAFMLGTASGILAGVLSTFAVLYASFWLFCAATLLGGAYAAVVLSFRFCGCRLRTAGTASTRPFRCDGGRRFCRRHWSAARDVHDGPLATLPVRSNVHRPGGGGGLSPQ
jgi:hypothetical protein